MNRSTALLMGTIVLAAGSLLGCQNKSSNVPTSSGVTDVSTPPAPASSTYTAPQPVTAQPVTYDTMPGNSSGGSIASGSSYTVKRGDTLYSIARRSYGDGKQWQKIASANPGVRPESLKVGQTLQIP